VQLNVVEASEGPGAEEAEVVAAGEGKRRPSGRERRDDHASWECCRIFFILRNDERMKVKGNMSIRLVVHRSRKYGVRTVGRPHCSISDYLIIKDDLLDYFLRPRIDEVIGRVLIKLSQL
jgi:hypothetical protein